MNGRIRVSLYAMIIVILALVSAFSAIPARADDGAPPPPAAPATDSASAQNSSPDSSLNEAAPTDKAPADVAPTDAAPAAPASDTAPTDVAPTDAVPTNVAPTDAAPTDVAPTDAAPTDEAPAVAHTDPAPNADTPADLSQVPAGTDVVVVNAAGDSVPLASQAASDIIATGDPMWCPSGATPGDSTCSPAFTNFNNPASDANPGLIAWLTANTSKLNINGVIWISNTYVSSTAETTTPGAVTIDGNVGLGNMKNYTLTINGGWTGGTTLNSATPSTFDGTTFNITNWNNDVTLNNLVIQNVSGSSNTALQVKTTKKINLTHVVVGDPLNVNFNAGPGAVLDNSSGTSDVNVTSSKFAYNNNGTGLSVISHGTITLNDILADHNSGDGANLNNSGGAAKNVVLSGGTLDFSDNGGNGLFIQSKGQITLTSITAGGNSLDGASLDNSNAASAMTVSLAGTNVFLANVGTGLFVSSKGAITINNLTASGSTAGDGTQLNNTYIGIASPQAVTFTGANVFNTNFNDGLNILTYGAVTLNSVTASGNGNGAVGYGVYVDNRGNLSLLPGVTLTGTNVFNSNHLTGLKILANGAISLNSVTASSNINGYGVYLDNCNFGTTCTNLTTKAVSLTGTNVMSGNYNTGLFVNSKGAITISNLTASNNGITLAASGFGYGAKLDNHFLGMTLPQTVTVNTSIFSANFNDGLNVFSYGAVTLNSVTANGSKSGYGANVNNRASLTLLPAVTVSGTNQFSNNWLDGLRVFTNGAISLNSVDAENNGLVNASSLSGYGVYLNNCDLNGTGPCTNLTTKAVTFTGTNVMSGNYNTGLFVVTKGVITISNLTATGNTHGYGAQLNNTFLGMASPQAVTITGINQFNTNFNDGLNILTFGAVTLNSVTANYSGTGYGANVNNIGNLTLLPGVTITGTNSFSNNWLTGLQILTNGAISLNSVTASTNGALAHPGYGIYLDNCNLVSGHCTNLTVKNVTLTGTNSASNNYLTGLFVNSKGVITISSLTASTNTHGYGAQLNNTFLGGALPQDVNITGVNQFNTNYYDGLNLLTYGAISLSSVTANGNGTFGSGTTFGYGVYLDNCSYNGTVCTNLTTKAVTLTGTNSTSNNYLTGLLVNSKGAITISSLTANGSITGYGAQLNNTYLGMAMPQAVTFTGINQFNTNFNDGLNILTFGAVTLNSITANGNGTLTSGPNIGYGLYVKNTGNLILLPGVTLTGNNQFNTNWLNGLQVYTNGAISLNNVDAETNGLVNADSSYGYGVYLDNCNQVGGTGPCANLTTKAVTLTGTNIMKGNYNTGLFIDSKGMINISNLTANGSTTGDGAQLNNTFLGGASPQDVNLTGINQFNNNYNDGLDVLSNGAISLNNVDAENNGLVNANSLYGYGVNLNNCDLAGTGPCTNTTAKAVTLTGTNTMSGNYNSGLLVHSKGAITVNGLTANLNGGYGADLDNLYTGITQPVTVNGGTFNGNLLSTVINTVTVGIRIQSNSTKTVNDGPMWCPSGITPGGAGCVSFTDLQTLVNAVTANTFHPAANGVIWIQNTTFASSGDIVFDGSIVGNWATWSTFSLTLQGGWSGPGTTISTTPTTLHDLLSITNWNAPVTLSDIEITGLAGSTALTVETTKNIALTRLNVHDNAGAGASLDNCFTNGTNCRGTGSVSVNYSAFNDNAGSDGLNIQSNGAISAINITAVDNGGRGAYLDNYNSGADTGSVVQPVTLTSFNSFNFNTADGLDVYSRGAITVSSITAFNNGGQGVVLDNCSGSVPCHNPGAYNVTMNGSNIASGNYNSGLTIFATGSITVSNLTANDNGTSGTGYGAYLDNFGAHSTGRTISLTGTNIFTGNSSTGLWMNSLGAVSAGNLTASNNGLHDDCSSGNTCDGLHISASTGFTLTGYGTFNENKDDGLEAYSLGAITLSNITATDNANRGVYLDNCNGSVSCANLVANAVTLSGSNITNGNSASGLTIFATGSIAVSNLTANDNGASGTGYGAYLDNFGTHTTLRTIVLSGINTFTRNSSTGLWMDSKGAVSVSNLTASNNGSLANCTPGDTCDGLHISDSAGFTITGFGIFNENKEDGLEAYSLGAITLSNITAIDNGKWGVYLDNCNGGVSCANLVANAVTLSGSNITNGNSASGLTIFATGSISISNLTANDNGASGTGYGAYLDNFGTHTTLRTISLSGINTFTRNSSAGLWMDSKGAVSMSNLTASNNGLQANCSPGDTCDGLHISDSAGITITGYGTFNENKEDGLEAYSLSAITLSNITAMGNGLTPVIPGWGYGVYLDNCGGGTPCTNAGANNVTLGGSNIASGNYGSGLTVWATGSISISNLTANDNGISGMGYGAHLNNFGAHSTGRTISLSGINTFTGNSSTGLWMDNSQGAVSVSNLTASNNGLHDPCSLGDSCDGFYTAHSAAVTISGFGIFNENTYDGLQVYNLGAITLSNITAIDNGNRGVYLDNCNGGVPCNNAGANNVTLSGSNIASGNSASGLTVWATGSISISNLTANDNGASGTVFGAYLDNFGAHTTGKTISLSGINTFTGNSSTGLWMNSKGAVSVSNLTASNDGLHAVCTSGETCDGLHISDSVGFTITGFGIFNENKDDGLQVSSLGAITVTNLFADHNIGWGAYLDNCLDTPSSVCSGTGNLTLNGTNVFTHNGLTGLSAVSFGIVTLNNVTASYNGQSHNPDHGSGAFIINCAYDQSTPNQCIPSAPHAVTLNGINNFNGNHIDGLLVYTVGAITASQVTASNNTTGHGALLDNQWSYQSYNITLTGNNVFNGNEDAGLEAYSNGSITMSNLTANGNTGGAAIQGSHLGAHAGGVYLDTVSQTASPVTITLTGFNSFNNNGTSTSGAGLYAYGDGAITISNLTANNNEGYGALLDNTTPALNHLLIASNITLTGFANFVGNGDDGLNFNSSGAFSATQQVTSGKNGGNGAVGVAAGSITFTCGTMYSNIGLGLDLTSPSAITLKGIFSGQNGGADSFSILPVITQACPLP